MVLPIISATTSSKFGGTTLAVCVYVCMYVRDALDH